jgi:hypothetical protein
VTAKVGRGDVRTMTDEELEAIVRGEHERRQLGFQDGGEQAQADPYADVGETVEADDAPAIEARPDAPAGQPGDGKGGVV